MTNYARLGLLAVALAPACDFGPQYCEGEAAPYEEAPATSERRVVAQVLPSASSAVDMLFVIDDSLSMKDEQEQLGIWSNELFDVLSTSSGELPDLHIGVVSSSVAIPGLPECNTGAGDLRVGTAVLKDGRFIRDISGPAGRERNYSGTLTDTFAKMARVGDSGCGFEQPFRAARLALSGNPGFLRDNALLLVVFVTDEDDCSGQDSLIFSDAYADACSELGAATSYRCFEHGVRCYDGKGSRAFGERRNCRPDESSPHVESVARFADFLKGLKRNPAQVVVAGIYGKPNHVTAIPDEKFAYSTPRLANVCGGGGLEGTGATPAIRMNALMAEFGGRASQSSICDSELSWAMRNVGLVTRGAATRSHCLRGALRDIDVAAPGLQPACRVEASNDLGDPQATRIELRPCDGVSDGGRCFTLEKDLGCEDTETQLAFRVAERAGKETITVACDVDVYAPAPPPIGEERTDE